MFERDLVTLELGNEYIKILVGSKKSIKCFETIKTPDAAYAEDNIVDVQKLAAVILKFLQENNIKTNKVSFTVNGQDIVVRHMETPIMDRNSMIKTLQWEVSQYLPDEGKDYYHDFEITDKINNKEKKVYKTLVVSVPKQKIDKYVALAEKLGLQLSAIDISSNNISRVFRNVHKLKKSIESIGIVQIGLYNSNFTILEKGRLFIQRDVSFGIKNVADEMFPFGKTRTEETAKHFLKAFSFDDDNENTVVNEVRTQFDTLFYSFEKIIQFYSTGKINKNLDMIYIVGEGSEILGIVNYVKKYFSTTVELADFPEEIGITTKFPKDCSIRYYANNVGLLLRKE
jgi:type IV pilus assembly protein PilM